MTLDPPGAQPVMSGAGGHPCKELERRAGARAQGWPVPNGAVSCYWNCCPEQGLCCYRLPFRKLMEQISLTFS